MESKQRVSYLEAINLFKEHCDVVLKDKHLQIFGYYFSVIEILKLIKDSDRRVYNAILFKWAADIGLHIE